MSMFIEVHQIIKNREDFDHVEKIRMIINTDVISSVIYLDATELPAKSEIIWMDNRVMQVEEDYETLRAWLLK